MLTQDRLSAEHHAIARRMVARGYRVIVGYGQGGSWVRNPDITRPPFTDEHSFLAFRKAKVLFPAERTHP